MRETAAVRFGGVNHALGVLCATRAHGAAAHDDAGSPGPLALRACPTSAGMADASQATKPSSFAPHPRPPHNAYGAPVGGKILTKRMKKNRPRARPATSGGVKRALSAGRC